MNTLLVVLVTLTVVHANNAPSVTKRIFGGASHIVGGQQVKPHSLPHQVALLITTQGNGVKLCGGSLIAPQWVLTAAHCTPLGKDITVVLGAHSLQIPDEESQVTRGKRVVTPSKDEGVNDDIALIQLRVPAVLNDYVKTIRLPSLMLAQKDLSRTPVVISGWGKYSDRLEKPSPFLRAATSTILDQQRCNYIYDGKITSKMLCIDGSRHRGVCSGDSGGPLIMMESDGERTLIGVTSFGSVKGCELGYPTVFTRVDRYLNWIANSTGITLRQDD